MRTSRRAGFSLLEIMVSMAVLAIILAMTLGLLSETRAPIAEGTLKANLTTAANAALDRMERELSSAAFASISPVGTWNTGTLTLEPASTGGTATAIQFEPITGWVSGAGVQKSPAVTYAFTTEAVRARSEAIDGVDNDSDGLIDELRLVRISNGLTVDVLSDIVNVGYVGAGNAPASEKPTIEQLNFGAGVRDRLVVTFTVAGRVGATRYMKLTVSRTIHLRNV